MRRDFKTTVSQYLHNKRRRRQMAAFVGALSLIVAFAVTHFLIKPAITISQNPVCGLEEHAHAQACYHPTLICGLEQDETHTHSDACYRYDLICGYVEHTHDAACFPEIKDPVIQPAVEQEPEAAPASEPSQMVEEINGIPEETTVVETNGIPEETTVIETNSNPEQTTVIETNEIPEETTVVESNETLEEISSVESEMNPEVIAGAEQNAESGNESGEEPEAGALQIAISDMPYYTRLGSVVSFTVEIAGGAAPYLLTVADVEMSIEEAGRYAVSIEPSVAGDYAVVALVTDTAGAEATATAVLPVAGSEREQPYMWEATVRVELTGVWADDLLAVARTQLGYRESEIDFIIDDQGERQGYTRYGTWYGNSYSDWCAMFVSFCLNYADIPAWQMPRNGNCYNWKVALGDLYEDDLDEYEPVPGDLIFFHYDTPTQDSPDYPNHVGIVERVTEERIYTIEGNANKMVSQRAYPRDSENVIAFANLGKAEARAKGLEETTEVNPQSDAEQTEVPAEGQPEEQIEEQPQEQTQPEEQTEGQTEEQTQTEGQPEEQTEEQTEGSDENEQNAEAGLFALSEAVAQPALTQAGEQITFTFSATNAAEMRCAVASEAGLLIEEQLDPHAVDYVWTPEMPGEYTFTVTAFDAEGQSAEASCDVRVEAAFGISLTADARQAVLGEEIRLAVAAENGVEPVEYVCVVVQGEETIFDGRNVAEFSVQPGAAEALTALVTATDALGRVAEASLTLPVSVRESETAADWEALRLLADEAGVWPDNLVAVAQSQLGYRASESDFVIDENGARQGWTRYGAWFGAPYEGCQASFIGFCLEYAGVPEGEFPRAGSIPLWAEQLRAKGLLAARGSVEPRLGDVAFFDWDQDGAADHAGVIKDLITVSSEDGSSHVSRIVVIEADSAGSVDAVKYDCDAPIVIGFGLVNRATELYYDKRPALTQTFEGADYVIKASYSPMARVQNATLTAHEILPGSEEYLEYAAQIGNVLEEGAEVQEARFFDIYFMRDGQEIEPTAPVMVEISFKEAIVMDEESTLHTIHFIEDEAQLLESSDAQAGEVETVTFETDSFSVFAVVKASAITTRVITANGESFIIEVTYGTEAGIPSGAQLTAEEILENSVEYEAYCAAAREILFGADAAEGEAAGAAAQLVFARFFDITILNAQGEKIEPSAPVEVKITYDSPLVLEEGEQVHAVHFAETGTEVIEAALENGENNTAGITFQQGSFSVTGTVVTGSGSSYWPTENGHYVIVVQKPSGEYYALGTRADGTRILTEVQMENGLVTFPNIEQVEDLKIYEFYYTDCVWSRQTDRAFPGHYLSDNNGISLTPVNGSYDSYSETLNEYYKGSMYYAYYGSYYYLMATGTDNWTFTPSSSQTLTTAQQASLLKVVGFSNQYFTTGYPFGEQDQAGGNDYTNLIPTGQNLSAPKIEKDLLKNRDGTYTLTLDVRGESFAKELDLKADVVIVLDKSNSMIYNRVDGQTRLVVAQREANAFAGDLLAYNQANPGAIRLSLVNFGSYAYQTVNWTTSLSPLQTAINGNIPANLTTGMNGADPAGIMTGTGDTGSTNWEDALQKASALLGSARPNALKYVIFITDGDPTVYMTPLHCAGEKLFREEWANISYCLRHTNLYGNGLEDIDIVNRSYLASTDEAYHIVQNQRADFYTVGIFGSVNTLRNLSAYAYTGDSVATHPEGHYAHAGDSMSLKRIMTYLKNEILADYAYTDAAIVDQLTGHTSTALEGHPQAFKYYRYVTDKDGNIYPYGTQLDDSGNAIGGTRLLTRAGGGYVDPVTGSAVAEIDILNTIGEWNRKVTVNGVERTISPALFDQGSKTVRWDLDLENGQSYKLEDGVTYKVAFQVWPDQETYDVLAGYDNGTVGRAAIESDPDFNEIVFQQDKMMLKTNEEGAHVEYRQATVVNGDETLSELKKQNYINPPPIELEDTRIKLTKAWETDLDESKQSQLIEDAAEDGKDYVITLILNSRENKSSSWASYNDAHPVNIHPVTEWGRFIPAGLTLVDENGITINSVMNPTDQRYDHNHAYVKGWTVEQVNLAAGVMVSETKNQANKYGLENSTYPTVTVGGETYYVLEKGRDYKAEEQVNQEAELMYKLRDAVYHPMLVDGVLKDVAFSDNGASATIVSHPTISDFNGMYDGNPGGATTLLAQSGLTAVNVLRPHITYEKFVINSKGERVVKNEEFTLNVRLDLPAGFENDQYLRYVIYDETITDDVLINHMDKHAIGDHTSFFVTIKDTQKVRIYNVPVGTVASFWETLSGSTDYALSHYVVDFRNSGGSLVQDFYPVSTGNAFQPAGSTQKALVLHPNQTDFPGQMVVQGTVEYFNINYDVDVYNMEKPAVDLIKLRAGHGDWHTGSGDSLNLSLVGNDVLAGAAFTLSREDSAGASTVSYGGETKTVSLVKAANPTDSNGTTTLGSLNDGVYYLTETSFPSGYALPKNVAGEAYKLTVSTSGSFEQTIKLWWHETSGAGTTERSLEAVKTARKGTLYRGQEGYAASTDNERIVYILPVENEAAQSVALEKVKESSIPDSWHRAVNATYPSDYRQPANAAEGGLTGAAFTLYDDDKTTVAVNRAGASLANLTTDTNGRLYFGSLSAGTYYLKEMTAPDGYLKNEGWTEINVTAAGVTFKPFGGAEENAQKTARDDAGRYLDDTGYSGVWETDALGNKTVPKVGPTWLMGLSNKPVQEVVLVKKPSTTSAWSGESTGGYHPLNPNAGLAGAKFTLYQEDAAGAATITFSERTFAVSPATNATGETFVSCEVNSLGRLRFGELPTGEYYLVETQAPAGYISLISPISIQVKEDGLVVLGPMSTSAVPTKVDAAGRFLGDDSFDETTSIPVYAFAVSNSAGQMLPKTGGPGGIPYKASGMALIALSALLYGCELRRKRERRSTR